MLKKRVPMHVTEIVLFQLPSTLIPHCTEKFVAKLQASDSAWCAADLLEMGVKRLIVKFNWSAVFESFPWIERNSISCNRWNRVAFYSLQVSGASFFSVCHTHYSQQSAKKFSNQLPLRIAAEYFVQLWEMNSGLDKDMEINLPHSLLNLTEVSFGLSVLLTCLLIDTSQHHFHTLHGGPRKDWRRRTGRPRQTW